MSRLKTLVRNQQGVPPLRGGHSLCQGCGVPMVVRTVLSTIRQPVVVVNATGCLEVFSTPYPESSWQLPWVHSLFGNAPAVAAGVAAALKAKGRTDVRVIGQGGDGVTLDIGFACLSGMFERGDDVLYVCYDNEAYMNTGVQRSGATPPAARTATTKPVGDEPGNAFGQGKNAALIAMASGLCSTTSTVLPLSRSCSSPARSFAGCRVGAGRSSVRRRRT